MLAWFGQSAAVVRESMAISLSIWSRWTGLVGELDGWAGWLAGWRRPAERERELLLLLLRADANVDANRNTNSDV